MKAVQITEIDKIEIRDIPMPEPKEDEVLIKVAAVGVNPVDWKIASGALAQLINQPLPLTLGWDVAGEVMQSSNGFSKGDKVYAMKSIGQDGTLSEYCVVKASFLSLAPSRLSLTEAAALPMVSLTCLQALFVVGDLHHSQRVLIQAGSGGIGSTAIQLAKAVGAYVIATTSEKNRDYVLGLGADEVIDYQKEDIVEVLKNNPVDVVLESLWGQSQRDAIQVIKKQGKLVSLSGLMPETLEDAEKAGVYTEFVFVQPNAEQLKNIAELVDAQDLKVDVETQYPFEEIDIAYKQSQQGRVRGKLVVTF
ncbi:NADP-dependent oxidoreductase [uncultured Vibrio sp.]|uniref:NADP-dependent oxidoreductase n=1 Tax=uncultured Vibrio sp. TaxID=114054 RepID=UPI00091C92BE|nr:NADP-dependent oxidoreductase [uncultured Vibrio sp.]OIQ26539.1 MAG: hypothetical protein BM561_01950 [Vibrio sp. MedPE-SWchi]